MKKIITTLILLASFHIGYSQKKVPKNTIAAGVTATITAKYFNVKVTDEKIVQQILAINKKDGGLVRYTVSYKDTPLGEYAEYRFVYNVEDTTYARNLFIKAAQH